MYMENIKARSYVIVKEYGRYNYTTAKKLYDRYFSLVCYYDTPNDYENQLKRFNFVLTAIEEGKNFINADALHAEKISGWLFESYKNKAKEGGK